MIKYLLMCGMVFNAAILFAWEASSSEAAISSHVAEPANSFNQNDQQFDCPEEQNAIVIPENSTLTNCQLNARTIFVGTNVTIKNSQMTAKSDILLAYGAVITGSRIITPLFLIVGAENKITESMLRVKKIEIIGSNNTINESIINATEVEILNSNNKISDSEIHSTNMTIIKSENTTITNSKIYSIAFCAGVPKANAYAGTYFQGTRTRLHEPHFVTGGAEAFFKRYGDGC